MIAPGAGTLSKCDNSGARDAFLVIFPTPGFITVIVPGVQHITVIVPGVGQKFVVLSRGGAKIKCDVPTLARGGDGKPKN